MMVNSNDNRWKEGFDQLFLVFEARPKTIIVFWFFGPVKIKTKGNRFWFPFLLTHKDGAAPKKNKNREKSVFRFSILTPHKGRPEGKKKNYAFLPQCAERRWEGHHGTLARLIKWWSGKRYLGITVWNCGLCLGSQELKIHCVIHYFKYFLFLFY